jgi:hypothetical protein
LSSEQPTRTRAAAAMPIPAVTIFFMGVPFVRSAGDGVVVRQVHEG